MIIAIAINGFSKGFPTIEKVASIPRNPLEIAITNAFQKNSLFARIGGELYTNAHIITIETNNTNIVLTNDANRKTMHTPKYPTERASLSLRTPDGIGLDGLLILSCSASHAEFNALLDALASASELAPKRIVGKHAKNISSLL
jgi:hypothetical protein